MSTYMNFFIRNHDNFIPIGTYNRATSMYELINTYASIPWEGITNITYTSLGDWMRAADEEIDSITNELNRINKMFELANTYTLEEAYEYAGYMNECEAKIEALKGLKANFCFMENILDDYTYSDDEYNIENILYVGIEVSNPTVEDIV